MKTIPLKIVLATALAWTLAAGAVRAAPTEAAYGESLTLNDRWIDLTRDVAWPAEWLDDRHFHYRKSVAGGFQMITVDASSGRKRASFDHSELARMLTKATGTKFDPLRLPLTYSNLSPDASEITMWVGDKQWDCQFQQGLCQPGASKAAARPRAFGVVRDLDKPATAQPVMSPDGKWRAGVEGFNVAIRRTDNNALVMASQDGHANERYDEDSLSWSPDGTRLVAYRFQPGFPRKIARLEAASQDAAQPHIHSQLYPKPGDRVDIDRPVLFEIGPGRQVPVDTDLFQNPFLLSPPQWRADSLGFSFEVIQRGHQQVRVVSVDAFTGRAHAVITETSETFVDTWHQFRRELGKDGSEILWLSERDGWRHLYLFDAANGKIKNQVTRGQWVVRDVLCVDEERRQVFFSASGMDAGRNPYLRQLFRVNLDGGALQRLADDDLDHSASMSKDCRYMADVASGLAAAPVMRLHDMREHHIRIVERADISKLLAAGWKPAERFVAKGRDGITDIWGIVVRPRHFDPSRKYPVIESIYAGPHDSYVPTEFWPFEFRSGADRGVAMQAQADLGFIVVQIDGMGTANRSKAFHDVAWKNLGDAGFPDRISWHRALAAIDPAYDISRVGIYGHSAGGQNTLSALLNHSDFYKAGVAYNGCYDNRMDKISWNEQWMGYPVDRSYLESSAIENAGRLQGKLLLVLGDQDSNVDPASTMELADALMRAGKDYELLTVQGEGHGAGRTSGPIPYVKRHQFDFFVRNLLGEPPPDWNHRPAGRAH